MIKLIIRIFIIFLFLNLIILNVNSDEINNDNNEYCPSPLVYKYSKDTNDRNNLINQGYQFINYPNNTESYCTRPCPSLFFNNDQWRQMMDMSLITGTLSFFATIFIIVTYSPLINPSYKNRHTFGILSTTFGIFLIMFTDVYNLKKRFAVGCPDPGRYAVQQDIECAILGIIFQLGCVMAVIWNMVVCIDLYLLIKKIEVSKKYDKHIIIGINLFCLILSFLPLVGKTYGYGNFGLGCWIQSFTWAIFVFWIPLSICLIISTVLVVIVLYQVYKIFKASNQKSASLKGHIKPALCCLLNSFEFFYMFGYSLYLSTKLTQLNDDMDNYVQCILLNENGGIGCTRLKLSMGAQFLFVLSLRLLGVSAIIFYAFNSKVKKVWLNSIVFKNRFVGKYFSFSNTTATPKSNQSQFIDFNETADINTGSGDIANDNNEDELQLHTNNNEPNNKDKNNIELKQV